LPGAEIFTHTHTHTHTHTCMHDKTSINLETMIHTVTIGTHT
jgi:hypothetical protein